MIQMMKFDMGGAAATLGAAKAVAAIQPPNVQVHFIIAACENMISGTGMRPGDILTASNGKTIEASTLLPLRCFVGHVPLCLCVFFTCTHTYMYAYVHATPPLLRVPLLQVNNTDAEGRLTLADALCYACKLKVDKVRHVWFAGKKTKGNRKLMCAT